MLKSLPCDFDSTIASLPFRETFHPMGYGVEIGSNSAEVITAAAKLWQCYPPLAAVEPVHLHVISGAPESGSSKLPSPPRIHGRLLSIDHGPDNFATADLTGGFAHALLSPATISDLPYLRYYFLEPLAYVMQAARHFVLVHASCISRHGRAILLCGDSGAGKTCLAYACAKRGWDFVSGDAVHIVRERDTRLVIGRPYEIRFRESAKKLFPELRSTRAELRVNGKLDLEMDTADLDIPVALQSLAGHLVFIERANFTRLEVYPAEFAMRKLEETICYGDERTRREQRRTLERFAGLPVWRLYYSSLNEAQYLLEALQDAELRS